MSGARPYEVLYTGSGGAHFRFAFDPILVHRLKKVPPQHRRWVPKQRLWYVEPGWVGMAIRCLDGEHDRPGEMPAPIRRSEPSPWHILGLVEGAPAVVVQAAYRALARLYHPDVGGSEEDMKVLNAAYEQLQHMLMGGTDGHRR